MSKWLACIGAGREQIAGIKTAGALGYRILAFDSHEAAPGFNLADSVQFTDFSETDAIIARCREYGVVGVVPVPLGATLQLVGAINDALGLPGITSSAARHCTDKSLFHQAVVAAGARRPIQLRFGSIVEAVPELQTKRGRFVIKPSRGAGSRGVMVLDLPTSSTLPETVTRELEKGGEILVEEFLSGPEVGVDGYILNGELHMLLVRDKVLTAEPYRQEVAYYSPSQLETEELRAELQLCARAVGLERCVFHADVIITDGGPIVVEMAGRPAGLLLSERFIPTAIGLNYLEAALKLTLTGEPLPRVGVLTPTALRFYDTPAGTVSDIPLESAIQLIPGVAFVEINARVGDSLSRIESAADVFGRGAVVTSGDGADNLAESIVRANPIRVLRPEERSSQ